MGAEMLGLAGAESDLASLHSDPDLAPAATSPTDADSVATDTSPTPDPAARSTRSSCTSRHARPARGSRPRPDRRASSCGTTRAKPRSTSPRSPTGCGCQSPRRTSLISNACGCARRGVRRAGTPAPRTIPAACSAAAQVATAVQDGQTAVPTWRRASLPGSGRGRTPAPCGRGISRRGNDLLAAPPCAASRTPQTRARIAGKSSGSKWLRQIRRCASSRRACRLAASPRPTPRRLAGTFATTTGSVAGASDGCAHAAPWPNDWRPCAGRRHGGGRCRVWPSVLIPPRPQSSARFRHPPTPIPRSPPAPIPPWSPAHPGWPRERPP